jgi:hypothetical protein
VASLIHWQGNNFGELDPLHSLRLVVPSATALMISLQAVFGSLFISILGIRRRQHPPLTDAADEAADVIDAAAYAVATEGTTGATENGSENGSARKAGDTADESTAR